MRALGVWVLFIVLVLLAIYVFVEDMVVDFRPKRKTQDMSKNRIEALMRERRRQARNN